MTAEFDQLVAEFEQFQAGLHNVDDRFEKLAGMRGELEALEVRATSADRAVTVVAGPGGAVTDIQVTEAGSDLTPQQLSSTIMATLREAVADAARKQAAIVQDYAGDEADVLGQVLETQSEVAGVPVEELREKVRPSVADDEPTVFQDRGQPTDATPSDSDSFLRNLSDEED